jgi:MFS transporter, OCT family, solute carrier family 22 (organic cation transporter), member 18
MKNSQTTLYIIYINVALYATCFQIQRPLEPFLVEKLGLNNNEDSASDYAKLQSFFAVMQMIGSIIAGGFIDKYGAKMGLLVSFLASGLSYYILSMSTSIELLYLSKVPTIFQSGFLAAQAAAAQISSDGAERVATLGRLTAAYTVGSILGPTIGGFLGSTGDYYYAAQISTALSLLSVVLTLLMSNESAPVKASSKSTSSSAQSIFEVLFSYFSSISNIMKLVWLLISVKLISSIANSIAASAFPIILKDIYALNEKSLGLSMSAMSAFNGVVNGFLLAPFVAFNGDKLTKVIVSCLTIMCLVYAIIAVYILPQVVVYSPIPGNGLYEFLGSTFILSIFQHVLAVTITGESTSLVQPSEKGTLLGLEHSIFAAARVFTPTLGVSLLKNGGVASVAGVCSLIFCFCLILWQFYSASTKSSSSKLKTT